MWHVLGVAAVGLLWVYTVVAVWATQPLRRQYAAAVRQALELQDEPGRGARLRRLTRSSWGVVTWLE